MKVPQDASDAVSAPPTSRKPGPLWIQSGAQAASWWAWGTFMRTGGLW